MFTICLFITFISIPYLHASPGRSQNESEFYLNDFIPRVVNGWPGKLGDVPYQVSFKKPIRTTRIYYSFCGGVITTPTKLLSAAHCFSSKQNICMKLIGGRNVKKHSISNTFAVAGSLRNRGYHSPVDTVESGQWRQLKDVVFPKTYSFPRDDIAIVWTEKPFVYNSYVNFIPFARKYIDYTGQCLVSGYGRISAKETSDKLLLAHLIIITRRLCNRMHRRNMRHFVCTSSAVSDVGKGDSGGPLVCTGTRDPNEVGGRGILVGIVSGHRHNVGSFFTRVSSYHSYIERNKCGILVLDIRFLCLIMTIHVNLLLF